MSDQTGIRVRKGAEISFDIGILIDVNSACNHDVYGLEKRQFLNLSPSSFGWHLFLN